MAWKRAWHPTLVFLSGESLWTEEPSGLQSIGLQRVGDDWMTKHRTTHSPNCSGERSIPKNIYQKIPLFYALLDCFWKGTEDETMLVPYNKGTSVWTSLVVQWLRIHLPMQETWVQSLVWEDSTCHRAAKPLHWNCWTCTARAHDL